MTKCPPLPDEMRRQLEAFGFRGRVLDEYRPDPRMEAEAPKGVYRFQGHIADSSYRGLPGLVTPACVAAWLGDQEGDIRVDLNSPGGNYFQGIDITNQFRAYGRGKVTMRVTGLAASAASVVAMAGERIEMMPGTMMMIHRAWTLAVGDAKDMLAEAAVLEKIDISAAAIYAARTDTDRDAVLEMMTAETWMTAAEAVEAGFADDDMAGADDDAGDDMEDDDDMEAAALAARRRADFMIARRLQLGSALAL